MVLQPVLPEKRDFFRSSNSDGVLPAAVSEGRTAWRNQGPPRAVVSGGAGAVLVLITESGECFAGLLIGVWQAASRARQMAAINFMLVFFTDFQNVSDSLPGSSPKNYANSCGVIFTR